MIHNGGVFVDSGEREKPMEHCLEGSGLDAGNAERKIGKAARGGCHHPGGMSRESGARGEWAVLMLGYGGGGAGDPSD